MSNASVLIFAKTPHQELESQLGIAFAKTIMDVPLDQSTLPITSHGVKGKLF